jgi:hypothetical protein
VFSIPFFGFPGAFSTVYCPVCWGFTQHHGVAVMAAFQLRTVAETLGQHFRPAQLWQYFGFRSQAHAGSFKRGGPAAYREEAKVPYAPEVGRHDRVEEPFQELFPGKMVKDALSTIKFTRGSRATAFKNIKTKTVYY